MKLLSEIQYKAEECKRQVTTSKEVTTYQLPEASQSTAVWEYILTIPETQPFSIPVVQPQQTTTGEPVTVIVKVQQPSGPSLSSAQPTSTAWDFQTDDFQPTFSCTFTTGGESAQHFWIIQSLRSYSQCACVSTAHHNHNQFHPLNFNQHRHQCHLPLIMNIQDLPASPASTVIVSPNQRISPHMSHQTRLFSGPPESSKSN